MIRAMAGLIAVLGVALAAMSFAGCSGSETACQKSGYGSRACSAEVQAQEEKVCGPGGHFDGFMSCGNRAADERREFREGWEEAEKEAEFYGE